MVTRRALPALAAAGLLLVTGLHVDGNHVSGAERAVFRVLNDLPSAIYVPAWVVMQFGNLLAVPALAAVAAVGLRRYRLAAAALVVGAAKWYGSRIIKTEFLRERPASILGDVITRDAPLSGQAFVSGHAVIAVGLAVVFHPYLGRRQRIVVWAIAALVCVTRVYVGAHLPLDVVGGACAGWIVGTLATVLTRLGPNLEPARPIPPAAP